MGKKYCITGGSGFLGYHIGRALLKTSSPTSVVLFDRSTPNDLWKDADTADVLTGFTFVQGNVLDMRDLELAFAGVDCVIHTAAFGLSNRDQLPAFWTEVEAINVGGTKNVIEACCRQNVPALVYTSSNNVVFDGNEILGGDETLPYTPSFKHADHYSRTKSIAEQMVLLVNGKLLSDGQRQLRTCALRLGGLHGPREQRHTTRIMNGFRDGIVLASFWYNEGLSDFVLIHNAVNAHIRTAEALLDDDRNKTVGGQAYFISDGQPINTFEYFTSIAKELGYQTPKLRIPATLVWIVVLILEMVPCRLFIALNMATFTRTEFLKLTTTHYFSIDKARRELGYIPTRPNDPSETIGWLKLEQAQKQKQKLENKDNERSSSSKCHSLFFCTNSSCSCNGKATQFKLLSVLLLLIALVVAFLRI